MRNRALAIVCFVLFAWPAPAAEPIEFSLPKGTEAASVLEAIAKTLDVAVLYAPGELTGRPLPCDVDLRVPQEKRAALVRFVVDLCEVDGALFESPFPLLVVRSRDPRLFECKLAGHDRNLRFDGAILSWESVEAFPGTLSDQTVAELYDDLETGTSDRATDACVLLAYFGPRDERCATAMARVFEKRPALRVVVAKTLAALGYAARPAIDVLERAAKGEGGDAIARAVDAIRCAPHPNLEQPGLARKEAPARFTVEFVTTKGKVAVVVERAKSPHAADRLYNLVDVGYFDDSLFYKVVPDVEARFGIHSSPNVARRWLNAQIERDDVARPVVRGSLCFFAGVSHRPSAVLFFSLAEKDEFDPYCQAVGVVSSGLDVLEKLGRTSDAVDPAALAQRGREYVVSRFPELDSIKSARVIER